VAFETVGVAQDQSALDDRCAQNGWLISYDPVFAATQSASSSVHCKIRRRNATAGT
jgi:hypothetical protein